LGKQKIRVLITDDNRDVNLLVAATFGLKGYEVYKTYADTKITLQFCEAGPSIFSFSVPTVLYLQT
jgi:hypothetical protein